MDKSMKSVSVFLVFFIVFLMALGVAKIEAVGVGGGGDDDECLKEYGGDVGFAFCAPRIFPSFCYQRCRSEKGALGGKCVWGDGLNVVCYCDYCSDEPRTSAIRMKTNAA